MSRALSIKLHFHSEVSTRPGNPTAKPMMENLAPVPASFTVFYPASSGGKTNFPASACPAKKTAPPPSWSGMHGCMPRGPVKKLFETESPYHMASNSPQIACRPPARPRPVVPHYEWHGPSRSDGLPPFFGPALSHLREGIHFCLICNPSFALLP